MNARREYVIILITFSLLISHEAFGGFCKTVGTIVGVYAKEDAPPPPPDTGFGGFRVELGSVVYQVSGPKGLAQLAGGIAFAAFIKSCVWDKHVVGEKRPRIPAVNSRMAGLEPFACFD